MPGNNGHPKKRALLVVPVAVAAADLVTKELVRHNLKGIKVIIKGVFNLILVENTGVAFGLFREGGKTPILFTTAAFTALFLFLFLEEVFRGKGLFALSYSLILGGALGNLLERLFRGSVTDFIDLHWKGHHWPSFNLADASITFGIALLILSTLIHERKKEGA